MDYLEMVESYVRQAWAEGKTSGEIKQELVAKRWPVEMVQAVIDKLVKARVEQESGKLPSLNGPDFWSHPSWPVGVSWSDSHAGSEEDDFIRVRSTSESFLDKKYSKMLENTVKSQKIGKGFSQRIRQSPLIAAIIPSPRPPVESVPPEVIPDISGVPDGCRLDSVAITTTKVTLPGDENHKVESSETTPTTLSVTTTTVNLDCQPTTVGDQSLAHDDISKKNAVAGTVKLTSRQKRARAVETAKSHCGECQTLEWTWQKKLQSKEKDDQIRGRAYLILVGFGLVLILAVVWRFFVVK